MSREAAGGTSPQTLAAVGALGAALQRRADADMTEAGHLMGQLIEAADTCAD